jgi:hypothetical protein
MRFAQRKILKTNILMAKILKIKGTFSHPGGVPAFIFELLPV